MKIHIGCGNKYLPGWYHVDRRAFPHVDAKDTSAFSDGCASVVYACHVLEHYPRPMIPEVLSEWHRILAPGGTLRVAVPDLPVLFSLYASTLDLSLILGPLYGRQDYPDNTHHIGFDWITLKQHLTAAGFTRVRRYNWRDTEHAGLDDFSQSYYPHMDKDDGLLLSLNVEATHAG